MTQIICDKCGKPIGEDQARPNTCRIQLGMAGKMWGAVVTVDNYGADKHFCGSCILQALSGQFQPSPCIPESNP